MQVTEIEPGIFEHDATDCDKFNAQTIMELRRLTNDLVAPGDEIATLLVIGRGKSFGFAPNIDEKMPRQYVLRKAAFLVATEDYYAAVEIMRRIGKDKEIHIFDDREKALTWLRETDQDE